MHAVLFKHIYILEFNLKTPPICLKEFGASQIGYIINTGLEIDILRRTLFRTCLEIQHLDVYSESKRNNV